MIILLRESIILRICAWTTITLVPILAATLFRGNDDNDNDNDDHDDNDYNANFCLEYDNADNGSGSIPRYDDNDER